MDGNRAERTRGERGVTLIEVLMVVLIISIMAAIILPVYSNAMRRSRATALAAECETLYEALMKYHVDQGSFPADDDFDTATLSPLSTEGYFLNPESLTSKLQDEEILVYLAPDVGGEDQQFIIVVRHVADPSIIVAVVYTNIIAATGGWVDGVYVITEGDLEEADEIS